MQKKSGLVIAEFTDDSKMWLSCAQVKVTDYGSGKLDVACKQRSNVSTNDMDDYLKRKGFRVERTYNTTSTLSFRKVYEFARRFVLENEYDIISTNCKAFAATLCKSVNAREYVFQSDEENNKLHKRAATVFGFASTSGQTRFGSTSASNMATATFSDGCIKLYSPCAVRSGNVPRPGPSGRVFDLPSSLGVRKAINTSKQII